MVDVNKVSEIGRQAAEQGYETVKEYGGKKRRRSWRPFR
jgi:hypothetical protein